MDLSAPCGGGEPNGVRVPVALMWHGRLGRGVEASRGGVRGSSLRCRERRTRWSGVACDVSVAMRKKTPPLLVSRPTYDRCALPVIDDAREQM